MGASSTHRTATPIRIGGGEVGRCLTRIHHDRFTPAVAAPDALRDRAITRGVAFEDAIVEHLLATTPGAVVIDADLTWDEAALATADAIDADVPLVVGARLGAASDDLVGVPDLLVRFEDGYAPVEVKHHKVVGDAGAPGHRAPLAALTALGADEVPFRAFRRRDLLQVAHYWLLLDAAGWAGAAPLGGVIGSDDPLGCLWMALDDGEPSLLDQHAAWIEQATRAIAHGETHRDDPMVLPWMRGECAACPWLDVCRSSLAADDDPTLLRGIDAEARSTLASDGITTIAAVAGLGLDDERLPGPDVVLQARARVAGGLLRNETGDAPAGGMGLPRRATEIDLDIETHEGAIYLAGLLIDDGSAARYEPIADWTGTTHGERRMLEHLFARLADVDDDAVVFHWTDYEPRMLGAAAERHGLAIDGYPSVQAWFDTHGLDLCAWSRRNLVSPAGHSLKVIAPLCGFTWRDDDAGGLQSEMWFEAYLAGDATMRDRLLAYNEDDVVAQRAIRDWVRANDAGAGPGSGIPSAMAWPPSMAGTTTP